MSARIWAVLSGIDGARRSRGCPPCAICQLHRRAHLVTVDVRGTGSICPSAALDPRGPPGQSGGRPPQPLMPRPVPGPLLSAQSPGSCFHILARPRPSIACTSLRLGTGRAWGRSWPQALPYQSLAFSLEAALLLLNVPLWLRGHLGDAPARHRSGRHRGLLARARGLKRFGLRLGL